MKLPSPKELQAQLDALGARMMASGADERERLVLTLEALDLAMTGLLIYFEALPESTPGRPETISAIEGHRRLIAVTLALSEPTQDGEVN